MSDKYEVFVGNIGCVYRGGDWVEARKCRDEYREQSRTGYGRAAGEEVTVFALGDITRYHNAGR
jgi:hypothetical protein